MTVTARRKSPNLFDRIARLVLILLIASVVVVILGAGFLIVRWRLMYVATTSGADFVQIVWFEERRIAIDEYWHNFAEPTVTQRCRMTDDLLENYLFVGQTTRQQVTRLLGTSHETPHYQEPWRCRRYELGFCADIAPHLIEMCFDSNAVMTFVWDRHAY